MGRKETKRRDPCPSPLSLPFTSYLTLILIGDRLTTGDESGSDEQFQFKVVNNNNNTVVFIFPIIKFYKSALAWTQVARANLGGPVNVRVGNI